MLSNAHICFIISAALIVLGFVALLTQKTYLDSETGQPTGIKVPLKEHMNGDEFDVSFATVKLEDGSVLGMTDKYGRVMVNGLPAGEYQAQVIQGEEERTVTLRVDGGQGLKVVYLE